MNKYTEIPGPIEGYKIVNDDMTCRGVKFALGERTRLDNDNPLELCENGFHFCPNPSGVWAYYSDGRVFKIRAYGVLQAPVEPGADHKMVCREIELVSEVNVTGNLNTGNRNTGNRNTGNWNTGNRNTGDLNTGNLNTGNRNTGDLNTGNRNTGNRNTGNWNTGNLNTGNLNTGDWNCGSHHSGFFGTGEAPLFFFGKQTKITRDEIDWDLCRSLGLALSKDEAFDLAPFLALPNATAQAIKSLHNAFIEARKAAK